MTHINPVDIEITLTPSELEAVVKAVQIGKTKVGSLMQRSSGNKRDALRREYQQLSNAEAELSEAYDEALMGAE